MTAELRSLISEVAKRCSWDEYAIYALVSCETGGSFSPQAGLTAWTPDRTAIGLIQWTEGTLRMHHVPTTDRAPLPSLAKYGGRWRSWNVATWPVKDQVELIEKYFARAFESRAPKRPVDYYLAAWGVAPGLGMGTVLAVRGEKLYELNRVLDIDNDGTIRVSDLAKLIHRRMREHQTDWQAESRPKIDAGLTVPGVLVTIGFQVIRRRMLLA